MARVKKIVLIPNNAGHRIVKQKMLDLYTSDSAWNFTLIPRSSWIYEQDAKGVISLTLNEAVVTRYLKIHVKFDDWDANGNPVNNKSFLNEIAQMLRVYQEAESRTEEYEYDPAGNRTLQRITLVQSSSYTSNYYVDSDRLKTDGKYAFKYDNAGNLIEKGNMFSISGDNVTFTQTSEEGVEYWFYKYDLLNRLVEVKKNGTLVSEYGYDPTGLRVVKKAHGETVHYVFQGTEPIYEKNVTKGKVKSYVYAFGKHLARVDGVIGDPVAKKYWYSTDQVGSVRAITDETGTKVWDADYLAFGQQYTKNKIDPNFEEDEFAFTGKGFDAETGLYYYNARWYDSDTGRFISEDPMRDPNNPNLYAYCRNNPLNRIDPTGCISQEEAMALAAQNRATPAVGSTTPFTTLSGSTISGTYDQNGNLSSVSRTNTINTGGSGVTGSNTHTAYLGSDGNVFSTTDTTSLTKKDGGNVTITTVNSVGGTPQTWYVLNDKDGNYANGGVINEGDITLIGLRGWGSGKNTTQGKNQYDDMIVLATDDGRIGIFANCNFESTDETYYIDSKGKRQTLTGKYGDIADGAYEYNYGFHKNYPAFWVENRGMVESMTYNPVNKDFTIYGCHIHQGGNSWTFSEGCITIFQDDWDRFMSFYKPNFKTSHVVRDSRGLITGTALNYDGQNIAGTRNYQRAGDLIIDTI
jgi:RHS repeat-associated protein